MRTASISSLGLSMILVACGQAPVGAFADDWDAGWDAAAEGLCRVAGEEVFQRDVVARADNGTRIEDIRLNGVPASFTIGTEMERDARTRIDVEAAIAFQGVIDAPLAFRVAAAVEIADGLVELAPGAEVARAFSNDGEVDGHVLIDSSAQIEALEVPCAALSVDPDEADWLADDDVPFEENDEVWRVTRTRCATDVLSPLDWRGHHVTRLDEVDAAWEELGEEAWAEDVVDVPEESESCVTELVLSTRPGDGTEVTVLSDPSVTVTRLDEVPGYLRVRADFRYATLTGWVARDDVEPFNGGIGISGWGCGCGCIGCGFAGYGGLPVYRGPALVNVGTRVFADEDEKSGWAVVRDAGPFTVMHVLGADWVQLTEIPGIGGDCGRFSQAHVPAAAVQLPDRSEYL